MADPKAKENHQSLVTRPDVQSGLHVAFANFCWNLPSNAGVQGSVEANSMRAGALAFMREFLSLAEENQSTGVFFEPLETEPKTKT